MKKKIIIATVLIVVLIAFAAYIIFSVKINSGRNQLFKNSYEQGDVRGAYSALFFESPAIHNRPYIGFEDAPLTIIVVVDFQSETSKKFYEEKMPGIMDNYINTGQAKLYHKYNMLREELDSRKGRFIYASASRCYNEFAFNNTIDFNEALFSAPEDSLGALAEEFSIPKEAFISCIKNNTFQSLYEDMLETEQFTIQSPSIYLGINGQDNSLLLGDPSMELIQKRMRVKQIKVGI